MPHGSDRVTIDGDVADKTAFIFTERRNVGPATAEIQASRRARDEGGHSECLGTIGAESYRPVGSSAGLLNFI
jgi:hypothetical protein